MASSNDNGGVWDKNAPLRYVAQVIRKLDDGTYPTEATKCFCGIEPSKDSILAERDRYTISHRMVMCENCLLIRANPRMTREAYAEFYNNEYRLIYDGFPYQEKSGDDDFLFQIAANKGMQLKTFLSELDVRPQTVVDIGSDKGGTLIPFKEDGATVYGVELCERGRGYAEQKGIQNVKTVDELIAQGVKADLVILQDMIEHLLDLNELDKLKDILSPTGRIFIYTPGLLACEPGKMFQNAHTYQFIGATLEYVMEKFGYIAEILDDRVVSIWRYIGPHRFPPKPELVWRTHIFEHLLQTEPRTLPPVRTRCKFSDKEMLSNLETCLSYKVPMMSELIGQSSGPCIIIGGGPSVDGQIDKIKELAAKNYPVIVIERMYPWCHEKGIKPAFVVQLDASENVEEGFTHIDPDAVHLICSTTNPKIFEFLDGYKRYIFSGVGGSYPEAQKTWAENGYGKVTVVNTGGSVVLASISLATMLGFRNLHLFGFDCMVPSREKTYAAGIAGESVDRTYIEVEVGEDHEPVLTCTSFLAFAQQFFYMVETTRKQGMIESIDVYGESLINKMWDRPKSEAIWQTQLEETPGKSTQQPPFLQ